MSQLKPYFYQAAWLCLGLLLLSSSAFATTITIVNADGAGEGFNDPTSVAPVTGNSGTTLGQQRLNVFNAAAAYWADYLNSDVEIKVQASMDPLFCTASSATLGSAGPTTGFINFSNAPLTSTIYPVALANSLAGSDLNDSDPEIIAQFNSDIDNNDSCLSNHNWCYQIDGTCPSNSTSMYDVVLHELGHGLGFLTFVNSSGEKASGFDDHFMVFLKDNSSGKQWPDMTDSERVTSSTNNALVWTGTNVTNSSSFLTAGRLSGLVKLYAPNPYESGSSVSHWDKSLSPDELMEPSATPAPLDTLTRMAFKDMGWSVNNTTDTYALTVSKSGTGSGTVTSSPTGISCGSTCGASYTSGQSVTLTATAASDSTFVSWSGACSGTGTCTVSMTADQSVTATFNLSAPSGAGSALPAIYQLLLKQ